VSSNHDFLLKVVILLIHAMYFYSQVTIKRNDMHIIDYQEDGASCYGYAVSSDKEQVKNYLTKFTEHSERISSWLKEHCQEIAILKNLYVEDNMRGRGRGSKLLERFLSEAENECVEAIVIISDSAESNRFKLDEWYGGYGFYRVTDTGCGSVMVYPEEIGMQMKADLFP